MIWVVGEEVMEKRKRILAVDDSGIILRSIKKVVDDYYDVDFATSGTKAFQKLSENMYDLIILDYEMPLLSGTDVYNHIRSHEETAKIPVIFLTGVSDKNRVMKILSYHPEGYLLKPINEQLLVTTLMEILG